MKLDAKSTRFGAIAITKLRRMVPWSSSNENSEAAK